MEPVAIATAFVAALIIVGRAALLVAPAAALGFYRRVIFPNPERLRISGALILVLFAAPLILTARPAPTARGDATFWIEALGWYSFAAGVWVIAAPRPWMRFLDAVYDTIGDTALGRALAALAVAFGLFLAWVAFSVL